MQTTTELLDLITDAGLSYEAYQESWKEALDVTLAGKTAEERRQIFFARYNLARSTQVHKSFKASDEMRAALEALVWPQVWMVITEAWCGDSAFALPVIVETARQSEKIELKIVLRDTYPEIMDRFVEGGARSIPKLVALDAVTGDVLFTWGSRPEIMQRYRDALVESGMKKEAISAEMVRKYEVGGWQTIEWELMERLTGKTR